MSKLTNEFENGAKESLTQSGRIEHLKRTGSMTSSGKIRFPVLMEPGMKALIRAALPDPANEKIAPYLLRLVREDIVRRVEAGELDAAELLGVWDHAAGMDPSSPFRTEYAAAGSDSAPSSSGKAASPTDSGSSSVDDAPVSYHLADPLIRSLRNLRDGKPAALENPADHKRLKKSRRTAQRTSSPDKSSSAVPEQRPLAEPVSGTHLQILHLP